MTDGHTRLGYPHVRNDCTSCRERDADFHVLDPKHNPPGKRPALYCRRCVGEFLIVEALYSRSRDVPAGEPFQVEFTLLAPGHDTW